MNLPNKLTMLRMLMIPLFIACFYLPESWLIGTLNGVPLLLKYVLAAVVFLLAYVTDTLDGRIARARGLVTDFGKLMDPTADKLLTSAALIMLCRFEVMSFGNFLMPVFTFIIIAREIFVSGIRQLAAGKGIVQAVLILRADGGPDAHDAGPDKGQRRFQQLPLQAVAPPVRVHYGTVCVGPVLPLALR